MGHSGGAHENLMNMSADKLIAVDLFSLVLSNIEDSSMILYHTH